MGYEHEEHEEYVVEAEDNTLEDVGASGFDDETGPVMSKRQAAPEDGEEQDKPQGSSLLIKKILFFVGFGAFAAISAFFMLASGGKQATHIASSGPSVSKPQAQAKAQPGTSPSFAPAPTQQQPAPFPAPGTNTPNSGRAQQVPSFPQAGALPGMQQTQPQPQQYAPAPPQQQFQQPGQPQQGTRAMNSPMPVPTPGGGPVPGNATAPGVAAQAQQRGTSDPVQTHTSQQQGMAERPQPRAPGASEQIILKKLSELERKMEEGQTACPTDEESGQDAAVDEEQVQAMQAKSEELEQAKQWLVDNNRELREKNSFLRKAEKKHRLRVQKLEAELEKMRKATAQAKPEPAQVDTAKAESTQKANGPALPRGWEIKGMVSNLVSLENRTRQESRLLEVGDEIEGVVIKGINMEKNLVITSNGVAKARF